MSSNERLDLGFDELAVLKEMIDTGSWVATEESIASSLEVHGLINVDETEAGQTIAMINDNGRAYYDYFTAPAETAAPVETAPAETATPGGISPVAT